MPYRWESACLFRLLRCGWSHKIERTQPFRQIQDAEPYTERIANHGTFPNRNVERSDQDLTSLRRKVGNGGLNIIDELMNFYRGGYI